MIHHVNNTSQFRHVRRKHADPLSVNLRICRLSQGLLLGALLNLRIRTDTQLALVGVQRHAGLGEQL